LPALAAELVNNRAEAVVAAAPPAVQAAKGATASLPVIAIGLDSDPVASGLVASPSILDRGLERANQATATRGQP